MDIVASARPSYRRRNGVYIISFNLWMSRGPRDRPSAAEKKERQGCTGPVDRGKAVPATSADLVNCPQDFPLGSRGAPPASS